MIDSKEFRPMLELMLISDKWEIEIDAKGAMSLKLNGSPESVEAGLSKVSDEDEIEAIADKVEEKIRMRQIKKLQKSLFGGNQ